jgi:hypothetical protein
MNFTTNGTAADSAVQTKDSLSANISVTTVATSIDAAKWTISMRRSIVLPSKAAAESRETSAGGRIRQRRFAHLEKASMASHTEYGCING